jgi:hypothetical protein
MVMTRSRRPSPAMVVALVALFVAMGGASYAAFKLPKGSVGPKQIKANAVSSPKVKNRSLLAQDFKAGQLPGGQRGVQGVKGDTGAPGPLVDTLPSGRTLRGGFSLGAKAAATGDIAVGNIVFAFPLATSPAVTVIKPGQDPPQQCPGTLDAPEATPGNLCIYVRFLSNGTDIARYGFGGLTTFRFGASLYLNASAPGSEEAAGTWAVTAP